MRIAPGKPPAERCAEPIALQSLLAALEFTPAQAAHVLGCSIAQVIGLCSGALHLVGPKDRWDAKAQRHLGAWAEVAEALCEASPRTSSRGPGITPPLAAQTPAARAGASTV
jgi:hypothetical protein